MRWNKHKATNFKSRLRHFQSNPPLPAANLDNDELPDEEPAYDQPTPPNNSNDITSLLELDLNMCGDNPELQERTTMALSEANHVGVLRPGLTKIAPIFLFTSYLPFHGQSYILALIFYS